MLPPKLRVQDAWDSSLKLPRQLSWARTAALELPDRGSQFVTFPARLLCQVASLPLLSFLVTRLTDVLLKVSLA